MAENSKIQWTHHTFNPWSGCSKVHAGCAHCYAEMNYSVKMRGVKWGPNGTRVKTANWNDPTKWNRAAEKAGERHRVFCASLADVFEDWAGPILDHNGKQLWHNGTGGYDAGEFSYYTAVTMNDLRRDLFALIDATPNLDWLLLTKRPENIRRMWPRNDIDSISTRIDAEIAALTERWMLAKGFSKYRVSNLGRVEGPRGILGGDVGEQGHTRVTLQTDDNQRERVLVHRLVMMSFVGDPPFEGAQVRHLNGDARVNALPNLAWGTQSTNWQDSKDHGTHRRYSKLTEDEVERLKTLFRVGFSYAELGRMFDISGTQAANIAKGKQWSTEPSLRHIPNCWLGTSISDQATADQYVPELLKCSGLSPVLFLSVEPLLGPIRLADLDADWVIVGGESGPAARPCRGEWIESIIAQCAAARVPCFVKQMGGNHWYDSPEFGDRQVPLEHLKGGDWNEWPEAWRVRQFPNVEGAAK